MDACHASPQGSGTETSVGDLLDKEYVAAWGNGNAIVTFGDFRLGQKGAFISRQDLQLRHARRRQHLVGAAR